jgi:hypothetical protein
MNANSGGGYSYNFQIGNGTVSKYLRVNSAGGLEFINNTYTAVIATMTDAGALSTLSSTTSSQFIAGAPGANGQFTAISGSTNATIRNDGTNVYLLKSNSATNSFDSSRPLIVNLSTGNVQIDSTGSGGTSIGGTLGVAGAVSTSGGLTVTGGLSADSLTGSSIASAAQVLAGTSTTQAITPAAFAGNKSLSSNGYYKLPGGLIIQWGNTGAVGGSAGAGVTFPVAFTNVLNVQATKAESAGYVNDAVNVANVSTTGFTVANGGTAATTIYWFALGI